MAKPIESTPALNEEESIRFIKQVEEEQRNPTPARIKFLKEARAMKFNFTWPSQDT